MFTSSGQRTTRLGSVSLPPTVHRAWRLAGIPLKPAVFLAILVPLAVRVRDGERAIVARLNTVHAVAIITAGPGAGGVDGAAYHAEEAITRKG
jgi:hypothetical protein